ncbi:MAG: hypothetical protein K9L68_01590 [Spirochaetales bacterium]|nr:hypothetical protein [Spirochaetales bacterium]MCF7937269.1 hypothetical protein [Spirochaetales bacterium]
MSRKKTGELKVLADQSFTEKELVINPNDGFDLGLMMTEATVELVITPDPDNLPLQQDDPPVYARLYQKNECRLGTVELGMKSVQKLDGKKKVRLFLEQVERYPRIMISPA